MGVKNTPFKMNGFSGFGNSPLKEHKRGHTTIDSFTRTTYREKGYTDKKSKRRKKSKLGYRVGRFFQKLLGGKGSRGPSSLRIACGPGGCKK